MAFERDWDSVPIIVFTQDGKSDGTIVISDTSGFRVKQRVVVEATSQATLTLEVKKVLSTTTMVVGPLDKNLLSKTDLSLYTLANSATVFAEIQGKVIVPKVDQDKATYEQEPVVARRVINVDHYGRFYTQQNPMPVEGEFDVTIGVSKKPTIINLPVLNEDTEIDFELPITTKKFKFRIRDGKAKARLAYESGASGYWTVERGSSYEENDIDASEGITLYFEVTHPNVIAEILYWE